MKNFWKTKKWYQLTDDEWESLCDRCGKCCLEKLENFTTKDVFFTSIACDYLEIPKVKCKDYKNRFKLDVDCSAIKDFFPKKIHYLPKSCSYRLLFEGLDLPEWHPLITGDPFSTIKTNNSIKDIAITFSPELELEDYIIFDD